MITTRTSYLSLPVAGRHLVKVDWSAELLAQMVRQGWECWHAEVENGIPDDADLVNVQTDGRVVTLYFEHPSFAAVLEDAEVPWFDVTFRTKNCPD